VGRQDCGLWASGPVLGCCERGPLAVRGRWPDWSGLANGLQVNQGWEGSRVRSPHRAESKLIQANPSYPSAELGNGGFEGLGCA
jgi:hypothetical protein